METLIIEEPSNFIVKSRQTPDFTLYLGDLDRKANGIFVMRGRNGNDR